MPVLLSVLPAAFGVAFGSEWVERGLFVTSAGIGMVSTCRGKKIHGMKIALNVCAVGLALLALARMSEENHWNFPCAVIAFLGGLTVALSHLINLRLCRMCPHCRTPSS